MRPLVVERYELVEQLASGGMAIVYLGRLRGERGFSRAVAVKRLHAHLASDPQLTSMLLDEARLASRIRHPNVVSTLDVLRHDAELLLVMDYVHGASLSTIAAHVAHGQKRVPLPVVGAIVSGVLQGLHAAHEARDEHGAPLGIVHRDVSPQNILVGVDGVARVADFGIAKAAGRIQTTTDGQVKGKAAYMAPEQIAGVVDRRTDVFAVSVVLWELLTGRRLFHGDSQAQTLANVLACKVAPPQSIDPSLGEAIDELVLAGLDRSPDRRFPTARDMDDALRRCIPVASWFDVAEWLGATMGPVLGARTAILEAAELGGRNSLATVPLGRSARTDDVPIDFATHAGPSPKVRFRLGAAAFGALTLAGLAYAGVYVAGARHAPAEPSTSVGTPAAPLAVSATATEASQQAAPSASVQSAPVAPAPQSAWAVPDSTTVPSARRTGRLPTESAARAQGAPPKLAPKLPLKKDCSPPYVIDARGKHFKEECLD
jgi:serine/threonine-protein kinase